jgi:hypothetical protein
LTLLPLGLCKAGHYQGNTWPKKLLTLREPTRREGDRKGGRKGGLQNPL